MVYLLLYLYYDDCDVLGCFTTKEKAEEAKKKAKRLYTHILTVELDKLTQGYL